MTRRTFDWERIEREYRAGVLSIREIARQHDISDGAIRRKAKDYGWERDLSDKVKAKVRANLVRKNVRTDDPLTEKDIVDQAAATQIAIVRSHQSRLENANKAVDLITEKLLESLKETENKESSLHSQASIVVSLSNAMKNFITLERQAFNIVGDVDTDGNSIKDKTWNVVIRDADAND